MATGDGAAASNAHGGIFHRLDQLNEFDRQPVTDDKLYGGSYFAGSFAGEHVAATEFVIGALFVQFGATAYDVVVGLLLGNLLAVLSWTLVCCPIAVQTRLTLYWYLRKIAGPVVTVLYNVLNAVLYCVLAGAMITVSASAVKIPFGIPEQSGWLPSDFRFVLVVLAVGAVVVTLAILGFKRLAEFATVCSPWMLLMFVAGALVMFPTLGSASSARGYWNLAAERVWTGPSGGQADALGFWHIVAFAWVCNLAMHLGLSDMALFRYARRSWYGVYSAFGMYLGHYLAWICAGIMLAAVRPLTASASPDSGTVAFESLGAMGVLAVVLAGWTTSNPTLYRAGLALQVVTPGWPRWLVTLLAGTVTTIIACSPFVFTRLLDFVAIYGILLAPVGAIVVAEHWLFPRIGLARYWSARKGNLLNWPALVSWLAAMAFAAGCWVSARYFERQIVHEFFLVVPVWIGTTVLYIVLAALAGAREDLPELPEEPAAPPPSPAQAAPPATHSPFAIRLYWLSGGLAAACLVLTLGFAVAVFCHWMRPEEYRPHVTWLTLAYFVAATVWIALRNKRRIPAASPTDA